MTVPSNQVMVDGESPIIGDLLNTYIQTVQTLADARNFIGGDGMQIYLKGFSAPGDGGQGNFYWNANGTGPDDGGATNP